MQRVTAGRRGAASRRGSQPLLETVQSGSRTIATAPRPGLRTAKAVRPEAACAGFALVALGFRQDLHTEVTSGYLLAFVLFPLWIGALSRFGGARLFAAMGVFAAAYGLLLSKIDLPPHMISGKDRNSSLVILLGTLAGIGVVLWARTLLPMASIAICYGAGMVLGGAAGFTASGDNAWKFVWAVPVAVVLLGLAARTGRRGIELTALAALMGLSVVFDSRSYLASFTLTAVLVAWQLRPTGLTARASAAFNAVLLAAVGWAIYFLGTTLLVDGYLGAAAQARSIAQIQQSGSLILGGRPELAATLALMRDHFAGYGPGVVPTPQDVLVAKTGMTEIGYAPNNGYVERYMFGGHFELHSVFGDLWANYGLAGLLLTGAIALFTVRGLAGAIAHRTGSAVFLFACVWTLWNVAFSPFYAAEPTILLTMGLVFLPVNSAERTRKPRRSGGRRYGRGNRVAQPRNTRRPVGELHGR